jgi:hypothetical protein
MAKLVNCDCLAQPYSVFVRNAYTFVHVLFPTTVSHPTQLAPSKSKIALAIKKTNSSPQLTNSNNNGVSASSPISLSKANSRTSVKGSATTGAVAKDSTSTLASKSSSSYKLSISGGVPAKDKDDASKKSLVKSLSATNNASSAVSGPNTAITATNNNKTKAPSAKPSARSSVALISKTNSTKALQKTDSTVAALSQKEKKNTTSVLPQESTPIAALTNSAPARDSKPVSATNITARKAPASRPVSAAAVAPGNSAPKRPPSSLPKTADATSNPKLSRSALGSAAQRAKPGLDMNAENGRLLAENEFLKSQLQALQLELNASTPLYFQLA